MTITCSWCGKTFDRLSGKGPVPKYCSATCRQRAYETRRVVSASDALGRAWKGDVAKALGGMPAITALQGQIAASFPKLDLTPLLPRFDFPKLLGDEWLEQIRRAALRLHASLPHDVLEDEVESLLSSPPTTTNTNELGGEEEVVLLILAAVASVAMIRFKTAELLVEALGSLLTSGVLLVDLIGEAYTVLSEHAPDDRLLSWALALTLVLGWIRNGGSSKPPRPQP